MNDPHAKRKRLTAPLRKRSRSRRRLYTVEKTQLSFAHGRFVVSIVRIGLSETKNFSEGYDAIFGKSKNAAAAPAKAPKKKATAKTSVKTPAKKKTKKK